MKKKFANLVDEILGNRKSAPTSVSKPPASEVFGSAADGENPNAEPVKVYDNYGGEEKLIQNTEQYKCPSCGASLKYSPKRKSLHCDYCDTDVPIGELSIARERVLDFTLDKHIKWNDETRVFRCESCGAENVFDKDVFAAKCTFCDSPSITEIKDLEGIRPNAVVPFILDSEQAREAYLKWAKHKFFAPKQFRTARDIEKFGNVYSPSWTFDSQTFSNYSGIVGDYYYVTVGSGKNRRTERRVRYRPVRGTHSDSFDDININSARELDDSTFRKLKPFMTTESVEYNRKFLAGYTAEHYRKPLNEGWGEAKKVIDTTVYNSIRHSLRCDVVQSLNVRTDYNGKMFKYVLLPIFIVKHLYKKKRYITYINGRTGKTVGKYPVAVRKVLGLIGGILAIGLGALLLVDWLTGANIFTFVESTGIINLTNKCLGVGLL